MQTLGGAGGRRESVTMPHAACLSEVWHRFAYETGGLLQVRMLPWEEGGRCNSGAGGTGCKEAVMSRGKCTWRGHRQGAAVRGELVAHVLYPDQSPSSLSR